MARAGGFHRVSEVESIRALLERTPAATVSAALEKQLVEHRSGWLEKEGGTGLLGSHAGKSFKRRWCAHRRNEGLGPRVRGDHSVYARACLQHRHSYRCLG
jgi:hypothetical protein|eukprot:COSAG01_NODE_23309_length_820_cov_0.841886_1_plen_101_part_00